jgi:ABC-2 type transport system ATP-binding protein
VDIETASPSEMLHNVRQIQGVREATIFGHSIHALIDSSAVMKLQQQLPSARIEQIQPSLEDIFVTLTYKLGAAK